MDHEQSSCDHDDRMSSVSESDSYEISMVTECDSCISMTEECESTSSSTIANSRSSLESTMRFDSDSSDGINDDTAINEAVGYSQLTNEQICVIIMQFVFGEDFVL